MFKTRIFFSVDKETDWKCLSESASSDLSVVFQLKASPQSHREHTSNPPSIHPSIRPSSITPPAVLTAGDRGQSPPRQAGGGGMGGGPDWQLQRWRERGGKEEFALSCQTPRWMEAYMPMVRVEYTCSFLLEGRKEKTERCWFFCCVSSTSCWD